MLLLRKLESARQSLQAQVLANPTACSNAQKPVSFLRSLWNAVMDDDQPSWSQTSQESDPAKCIKSITETQQYLREFFQLKACNCWQY